MTEAETGVMSQGIANSHQELRDLHAPENSLEMDLRNLKKEYGILGT